MADGMTKEGMSLRPPWWVRVLTEWAACVMSDDEFQRFLDRHGLYIDKRFTVQYKPKTLVDALIRRFG